MNYRIDLIGQTSYVRTKPLFSHTSITFCIVAQYIYLSSDYHETTYNLRQITILPSLRSYTPKAEIKKKIPGRYHISSFNFNTRKHRYCSPLFVNVLLKPSIEHNSGGNIDTPVLNMPQPGKIIYSMANMYQRRPNFDSQT